MNLAIKVFVCLLAWTIVSILVGSLFGRLLKILGAPIEGEEPGAAPTARGREPDAGRQDPGAIDVQAGREDGTGPGPSAPGLAR